MTIHYLQGDATEPVGEGTKIIAHVTNNCGTWGAGFVRAISAKWEAPEHFYREMRQDLGRVQMVLVAENPTVLVANMCAQDNTKLMHRRSKGTPLADLEALSACLQKVVEHAKELNASIHLPYICTGIGGLSWSKDVEPTVSKALDGLEAYVYEFVNTEADSYIEAHK